jgi:hypothetical protein
MSPDVILLGHFLVCKICYLSWFFFFFLKIKKQLSLFGLIWKIFIE